MKTKGNKSVLKTARTATPAKTASAATPPTKTASAEELAAFAGYWRQVFASPGVRFARQIAALFGFDCSNLEEWMLECVDSRADPGGRDGKRRRLWWDLSILQIYGAFFALKEKGVSDGDCARGVEIVKPYAVEYWKVPRGKETINGNQYQIQKDDERYACTAEESRIFHDAIRRLWLFLQAFDVTPTTPETVTRRAGCAWMAGDFDVARAFEIRMNGEHPEWFKGKSSGHSGIDARSKGSGWRVVFEEFAKFCKGISGSNPKDSRFKSVLDRVKEPGDLQRLLRELHRREDDKTGGVESLHGAALRSTR